MWLTQRTNKLTPKFFLQLFLGLLSSSFLSFLFVSLANAVNRYQYLVCALLSSYRSEGILFVVTISLLSDWFIFFIFCCRDAKNLKQSTAINLYVSHTLCTLPSGRTQPTSAKLSVFVVFVALKTRIPQKICMPSCFVQFFLQMLKGDN